MNIVKELLKAVSNYPGGYRAIYELIYERNRALGISYEEQSIRNTLTRLKKKGLLSNKNRKWEITEEGKSFLRERKNAFVKFTPRIIYDKNIQKTTIIIFDIPEKKRLYRDWLRNELIGFGFELIQKSVWFGPSLPKEFISYLGEKNILQYLRFFRATESDLI
jgi:DNA-binding transcriptional regulator PaaX